MGDWPVWLSWVICAFLFLVTALNLAAHPVVLEQFKRWDLPPSFRFLNAATQGLIGLLILMPATTPIGLLLGVLDCLVIFIILGRKRDFGHFAPGLALLALILVDAWGFGLIG